MDDAPLRRRLRLATFVVLLAFAIAGAAVAAVAGLNRDRAATALVRAQHAERIAHRNAIDLRLRQEKICSDSHPEFCRALADRLLRHTTPRQSHQLWCELLAYDGTRFGRQQRKRSRCPPPMPAP